MHLRQYRSHPELLIEGYLYALRLDPVENRDRIAWQFKAAGAVNTQVALAKGWLYFGCNGGSPELR